MANRDNRPWNLESFIDSFILELDKAQDTLALKGITRKLTYTVRDVALDLHIFPQYHDGEIRFVTAGPGEDGASRLSIQLGSISNRQIQEAAEEPISKDDMAIDVIEEIDEDVRDSLRKVGVRSARDLERMERRNVDLEKVVSEKAGAEKKVSYGDLANLINKARRQHLAPRVSRVSLSRSAGDRLLKIEGDHLLLSQEDAAFPMALVNDRPVAVVRADERTLHLTVPAESLRKGTNRLQVALDPYAVVQMEIKT
jgi:hypothetical protein